MEVLQAKHLKKYYGSGDNLVKAVDDINFSVKQGEFVAIVGTSGSGKTTLLNLLGGLDYADQGEVIIGGQSLLAMKDEQRTVFRRRKIGFVFQHYNLLATANVYKNVILPIRLDGNKPDESYIEKILYTLGLSEKANQRPNQLSGGQQQRVAIARALAAKPTIILADEPTGNLDSRTSAEVLGLLKMSSWEFNQSIIMITHNEEIAQMSDRILHIEDGRLVGGNGDV
ncbi:MAG: ABC transporter ATP-binding protein [Lachnospiraceae bacterium]